MRYYVFVFFLICLSNFSTAQNISKKQEFLKFNFGGSYNGTGDIYGLKYNFVYGRYFANKRFFWDIAFEGTIHDDETINFFFEDDQGNNLVDKSRFVVSGAQITGDIGLDFIDSHNHSLHLSIGPVIRYQTSSIPDISDTFFPVITDLPFPVQRITFIEPFRTLSLGGVLKFGYSYTFQNAFLMGFTSGFQTDTNGDSISFVTLTLGKRF